MPRVEVNGIGLQYQERGSGAPLLLIMGYGTSAAMWGEEYLDRLARSFRVIALDNRGTGGSDKRDEPIEIATLADDAAALLEALELEAAHVFGVSMGGMIAQELALRHPERVRGLVLGCTHCGGPKAVQASPEVLALIAPAKGMPPREAVGRIYQAMTTDETRRDRLAFLGDMTDRLLARPTPVITLVRQMEAITRFDAYDRLDRITAPALVITGDCDMLVPPENSRSIAERIPGARLAVIPGVAHNFFWEAHEHSARLVEAFLWSCGA
jgi:3-oxoadipate enol-lactonase